MPTKTLNVEVNTEEAQAKTEGLAASMGSLGASILRMGGIIAAFTAFNTLAGQINASIQSAIEFESQLADIQKVTSQFTADKLEASITQMIREIPLARKEIASIVEEAGRLGIEGTENIEKFTRTISQLTVATNLSAKEASKNFARIVAVTDATVEDIDNLGAVVNELSNNMAVSADEIVGGMQRISAAASRFGLAAEEISALSASITEVSATARRANTRLRRVFQALQEPKKVKELSKALSGISEKGFKELRKNAPMELFRLLAERFNQNTEAANVMIEVFGTASRQALAGIAQNLGGMNEALNNSEKQFSEVTSLLREFGIRIETTRSKTQLLSNEFEILQQETGQALLDEFNSLRFGALKLVQAINRAVFGITKFRQEAGKLIGQGTLDKLTKKFEEQRSVLSTFGKNLISLIVGGGIAAGTIASGGTLPFFGVGASAILGGLTTGLTTQALLDRLNFGERFAKPARKRIIKSFKNEMKKVPENTKVQQIVSTGLRRVIEVGIEKGLSEEQIRESLSSFRKTFVKRADKEFRKTDFVDRFAGTIRPDFENLIAPSKLKSVFGKFKDEVRKQFESVPKDLRGEVASRLAIRVKQAAADGVSALKNFDTSKEIQEALKAAKKSGKDFGNTFINSIKQGLQGKKVSDLTEDRARNIISENFSGNRLQRIQNQLSETGTFKALRQDTPFEKMDRDVQSLIQSLKRLSEQGSNQLSQFDKTMQRVSDSAASSFQDTFVTAMRDGFDSVSDALDSFALSFIKQLQRIAANNAAQQLFGQGQKGNFGLVGKGLKGLFSSSLGGSGGILSFGDTPGVMEAKNGAVVEFAKGDKFAASKTKQGLENQVGSKEGTVVNQNITNEFPVTPDSKIDRRIQQATPRIVEQAKNQVMRAIQRGESSAKTVRKA